MKTPGTTHTEYAGFNAAAIILAGGSSTRMKSDKSLLDIQGVPLIVYIVRQLKTCFPSVIISTNHREKYEFLGVPIVRDDPPQGGPVAGMLAGLMASPYELNFIMACDIPVVYRNVIRSLFARIDNYDVAIPSRGSELWEPFFGLYRRRVIPLLRRVMRGKKPWMRTVLDGADVVTVDVDSGEWPKNINTQEEYHAFLQDIELHDPILHPRK